MLQCCRLPSCQIKPLFLLEEVLELQDTISTAQRLLIFNYLTFICFCQETEIPARGKGLVKTDIQIKVPRGTYGRIAPRSGLSWKHHIDIGAGVVDEDYRGNVGK